MYQPDKKMGRFCVYLLAVFFCLAASQTSRPRPKELLVFTVATDTNHDGFEQFLASVEKHGIKLKTVGAGQEWTGGEIATHPGGGMKINLLKKVMEEYKDRDDLAVLMTDSYDAIMHGTETEILDKFMEFNAGVVFSAEVFIWPDAKLASKYPPVRTGESRYLNSGGYMGYAPDVYKLLTDHDIADSDDDQLYFTNLFIDEYQSKLRGGNKYTENTEPTLSPNEAVNEMTIKLDKRSEIFQTLNGVLDQVEVKYKQRKSSLYNIGTGSQPLVIHGNGPIKAKFNKLVSYLNGAWTPSDGCLSCKQNLIDVSDPEKLPTIFMSPMVLESTPFLYHWLDRIEKLSYPKNKLDMFIVNRMEYHEKLVSEWVAKNKDLYRSMEYIPSTEALDPATARNIAFKKCMDMKCEYLLTLDSVAQLTKADVLEELVSYNKSCITPVMNRPGMMFSTYWTGFNEYGYYAKGDNYEEIITHETMSHISPVMNRPAMAWSTFWGAATHRGYYERSDDYNDIISHKKMGIWNVPYATGVLLIKGSKLKLLPENPYQVADRFPPSDSDVAFAWNARQYGLNMHVVNMDYYGHLINPDTYDTSRTAPELSQLENNKLDWETHYLHRDFFNVSVNESHTLDQPCPDVFWFPITNEDFCDDLVNTMEAFGKWSSGNNEDTRLQGGYENVPTRDIHMNQVGLEETWLTFLRTYVHPVQLKVFQGYHSNLQANMNFVVRYRPDEQPSLRPHHDASTFTVNMALNKVGVDYEGGGVRFLRYDCILTDLKKGWMLMHPGRLTHFHEGLKTTSGTRYIMVSFVNP